MAATTKTNGELVPLDDLPGYLRQKGLVVVGSRWSPGGGGELTVIVQDAATITVADEVEKEERP